MTKDSMVRITEARSVEWVCFGINVNGIAPGAFSSEMMDGMLQRVGDIWQRFPCKRLGDPPSSTRPSRSWWAGFDAADGMWCGWTTAGRASRSPGSTLASRRDRYRRFLPGRTEPGADLQRCFVELDPPRRGRGRWTRPASTS